MSVPSLTLDEALDRVAAEAGEADRLRRWPAADLDGLAAAGAMRWAVPIAAGGDGLPPLDLHLNYERVATASVATALVLTQRDAAVGLIEVAADAAGRADLLRGLAANQTWATVGIAQLTTSRQGGRPALTAAADGDGYRLDGLIPWCTGADHADAIVTGAATGDGRQVLVVVRPTAAGVTVDAPMPLVALSASHTAAVRLAGVRVPAADVLRGASTNALAGRRNGLTLGQSFIATGLCQAAIDLIGRHDSDTGRSAHAHFAAQLDAVRAEVHALCQPGREADAAAANSRVRATCNDLALRVTHAAVALYKGSALLAEHPAQRLAREAMFLLVWSCPNPVIDCTVDLLAKP